MKATRLKTEEDFSESVMTGQTVKALSLAILRAVQDGTLLGVRKKDLDVVAKMAFRSGHSAFFAAESTLLSPSDHSPGTPPWSSEEYAKEFIRLEADLLALCKERLSPFVDGSIATLRRPR